MFAASGHNYSYIANSISSTPVSLMTPELRTSRPSPVEASSVSWAHFSPIPSKLAERIWQGEYIDLQELLHARLGASSTDALLKPEKATSKKTIASIEDWVVCFNSYISLVALRKPESVQDLLAYSSTIVKASKDFLGIP